MLPYQYVVVVCEEKDGVEEYSTLFDYPEIILVDGEDDEMAIGDAAYDCAGDLALAEKMAEDKGCVFSYKIYVQQF